MSFLWKKIELTPMASPPYYLEEGDVCLYAREYIANANYTAGETNQLMFNFKKPKAREGQADWKYKIAACEQFAQEVKPILPENSTLAPIPTSKSLNDPEYDKRMEYMFGFLKKLRPDLSFIRPIVIKQTIKASHAGGPRKPYELEPFFEFNGLPAGLSSLLLVDNQITTGSHFRVSKDLLIKNSPELKVFGLFWAKTIWPEGEDGE